MRRRLAGVAAAVALAVLLTLTLAATPAQAMAGDQWQVCVFRQVRPWQSKAIFGHVGPRYVTLSGDNNYRYCSNGQWWWMESFGYSRWPVNWWWG